MKKQDFKKAYSEYRNLIRNQYIKGRIAFGEAIDSDSFLRFILMSKHEKPVSIKVWLFLNK